ncbi:MAG: hypothetical protein H6518_03175 [Microthrixaceae bacterium]|nr:hypothetical protein [Microthrixaceae bacterium]
MLVSCWSAKGGSGTTVVAVALALVHARATDVLLVDLAGDVPSALGLAEPESPGLAAWLAADDDVGVDALARLEVEARRSLSVLPRGTGPLAAAPERLEALVGHLTADPRPVVADCGVLGRGTATAAAFAGVATHSLLVTRPCYLALRRAAHLPLRPSGVVLVNEPGRALTRTDVEDIVGATVRAEVALDPAVARAVDSGLLASRLPRTLERALRRAA